MTWAIREGLLIRLNLGRGGIVNEAGLARAIDEGLIGGPRWV